MRIPKMGNTMEREIDKLDLLVIKTERRSKCVKKECDKREKKLNEMAKDLKDKNPILMRVTAESVVKSRIQYQNLRVLESRLTSLRDKLKDVETMREINSSMSSISIKIDEMVTLNFSPETVQATLTSLDGVLLKVDASSSVMNQHLQTLSDAAVDEAQVKELLDRANDAAAMQTQLAIPVVDPNKKLVVSKEAEAAAAAEAAQREKDDEEVRELERRLQDLNRVTA